LPLDLDPDTLLNLDPQPCWQQCDNYRPISLLSSIQKEVVNRFVHCLKDNDLLYEGQFGFLEKITTVHHLVKLTNYITEQLNIKKNYMVGVFLNLKKAFNAVPHNILLKKLVKKLGINDITLEWFKGTNVGGLKK
jgi:Reverse transcriptase (RNA-dependent DNA polymerase)